MSDPTEHLQNVVDTPKRSDRPDANPHAQGESKEDDDDDNFFNADANAKDNASDEASDEANDNDNVNDEANDNNNANDEDNDNANDNVAEAQSVTWCFAVCLDAFNFAKASCSQFAWTDGPRLSLRSMHRI